MGTVRTRSGPAEMSTCSTSQKAQKSTWIYKDTTTGLTKFGGTVICNPVVHAHMTGSPLWVVACIGDPNVQIVKSEMVWLQGHLVG
jgi:hypothetical protein